jgi:GDPmannose 4,6-dehydratase
MKKVLIFGVTGQDGILLSEYLLKKKIVVYGTTRKKKNKYLNKKIKLIYKKKLSLKFISSLIAKIRPSEIYFLIGQPDSLISFKLPHETFESNFFYLTYVINSCVNLKISPKIFYASSGEIFGKNTSIINEKTKKDPKNPYALSKYISMVYIQYMRKFYNLNISTGILFNHDSEFRSKNNLTKKVINYLNKNNFTKKLNLGDIDIHRDFGLAREYIVAMYKINQQKKAGDYIIARGKSVKVRDVINYAFNLKKLDYKNYTTIDKNKFSKQVLKFKSVNISKIKKINWVPKKDIFDLMNSLIK